MHWSAYRYNINRKAIEVFNIFDHGGIRKSVEDLKKEALKCGITKDVFAERLRHELMYYYWSKAEWEVIISPFSNIIHKDECAKIDVYDQIINNWKHFIDYVWSEINRKD